MAGWISQGTDGVMVRVWVVPGSSRTEVVGLHGDALKVRVSAPAERGKANRAVIRLLNELLVPAKVELVSGATSRTKTVVVGGVDLEVVRERLHP